MASKAALLLSLNLLFFTVVSSTNVPCPPPPCVPCSPKVPNHPPSSKPPSSKPPSSKPPPSNPPSSKPPPSNPPSSKPPSSKPPPSNPPSSNPPSSSPPSSNPPSSQQPSCPKDTLKFGVCADLLGLVNVQLGDPSKTPCCSLIQGLANLDAAVCLCTALKANVLGINLNIPIDLSLILKYCGKEAPKGFMCN